MAALPEPVNGGVARCFSGRIEIVHLLVLGIVDEPERISSNASHVRIHNRQRRAGSNSRIDCVAARSKRGNSSFRRERVRGNNHGLRCHGWGTTRVQNMVG